MVFRNINDFATEPSCKKQMWVHEEKTSPEGCEAMSLELSLQIFLRGLYKRLRRICYDWLERQPYSIHMTSSVTSHVKLANFQIASPFNSLSIHELFFRSWPKTNWSTSKAVKALKLHPFVWWHKPAAIRRVGLEIFLEILHDRSAEGHFDYNIPIERTRSNARLGSLKKGLFWATSMRSVDSCTENLPGPVRHSLAVGDSSSPVPTKRSETIMQSPTRDQEIAKF